MYLSADCTLNIIHLSQVGPTSVCEGPQLFSWLLLRT